MLLEDTCHTYSKDHVTQHLLAHDALQPLRIYGIARMTAHGLHGQEVSLLLQMVITCHNHVTCG